MNIEERTKHILELEKKHMEDILESNLRKSKEEQNERLIAAQIDIMSAQISMLAMGLFS